MQMNSIIKPQSTEHTLTSYNQATYACYIHTPVTAQVQPPHTLWATTLSFKPHTRTYQLRFPHRKPQANRHNAANLVYSQLDARSKSPHKAGVGLQRPYQGDRSRATISQTPTQSLQRPYQGDRSRATISQTPTQSPWKRQRQSSNQPDSTLATS
jgi:hypothetical protein